MIDLNGLRVFEKVASLRSFSAAARALGAPKSSVSRAIAALEADLGTRLLQRTSRTVELTESGTVLRERCGDILARVGETVDYVSSFSGRPRGALRISAGIGFGINVLSGLLPGFVARYPEVDISLDLSSQPIDLVAKNVDIGIRMGALPSSALFARRLGTMSRYLCAAPSYLARKGTPRRVEDLTGHDAIEFPAENGRRQTWTFTKPNGQTITTDLTLRIGVNEALTIHRLVVGGAGIGCISGYLCAPDVAAGRLVHLLPEYTLPSVDVSAVFPSNRELAPAVRAFIDYLKETSKPGESWQSNLAPPKRARKVRS